MIDEQGLQTNVKPDYTLKQLINYFLKLGAVGFGGPVALVSYMHRDLVEERKWISRSPHRTRFDLHVRDVATLSELDLQAWYVSCYSRVP